MSAVHGSASARFGADVLRRRRLVRAGALLGFALGGFFDGILLHQVLQWHHLLSAVDAAAADLRTLVLADGLFHAAMYVIAIAGLAMLVRAHRLPPLAGDSTRVAAFVAIGFGTWHVVDTLLAHWWLGLHRVRMDVPNPLAWDVAWLVAFGLAPLALGLRLRAQAERRARSGRVRAGTAAALLALVTIGAGLVAARPPPGGGPVLVVFGSSTPPDLAMTAAVEAGAGILWFDARAGVWLLDLDAGQSLAGFYAHGARFATRSTIAVGCLSWLRVGEPVA